MAAAAGAVAQVSDPPLRWRFAGRWWTKPIPLARPPVVVAVGVEVTTVADDEVVIYEGPDVRRFEGLAPDTEYDFDGVSVRTLPRPGSELLCRFATVNDVHFGETECGILEGYEHGPVFRSEPGEDPYPEVMNRGAIEEIAALDPAAVVVKGDLTAWGTTEEYERFLEFYAGCVRFEAASRARQPRRVLRRHVCG